MWQKLENLYENIKSRLWLSLIFHGILIAALVFLWLPVAQFFYDSFPPLGNDYYQFTSYLKTLDESFRLPPMSWRPDWFMGQAHIYDHPWLHVYLALPLVKIFGLINGPNLYLVFCLFLFFLFTYLATYQISKNRLLAGFLSASLVWVNSLYIPLFSGGNSNFSSSLFFLPLLIYLIFKYYQTDRRLYFYLICLFQGLAFLAHPGTALFFIFPPVAAVLFLYSDEKVKFFSWKKIKDLFTLIIVSALIGGPLLFALIKLYLELVSFGRETGEGKEVLETFTTMGRFISYWIFVPLGLAFFGALFSKEFWGKIRKFIPFVIIFFYIFIFEYLYYIGKNPLRGNILPNRTYWLISVAAVFGIAVFWTNIIKGLKSKIIFGAWVKIFFVIVQISILGALGYLAYPEKSTEDMLEPTLSYAVTMRPFADAYPKEFVHKAVVKGEDEDYTNFFPEWLPKDDFQYRIHSLTPGFNIWWNLLYKPPLTHGYYDARSRQQQDWAYWMDTALAGELTYNYGQPGEVSKNSALFLIDWLSIKYMEGREIDYKTGDFINLPTTSVHLGSTTKISSYLVEDEEILEHNRVIVDQEYIEKELGGKVPNSVAEFMNHVEALQSYGLSSEDEVPGKTNLKPMTDEEVKRQLEKEGWADFFIEMDYLTPTAYFLPTSILSIKDDYVSPIASLTDAPACLVVGQKEGYNNLMRALGHINYNSNYLIPVRGEASVNGYSEKELEKFDCVILYHYKKISSNSWDKLNSFVEKGGKLFIDTGGEVSESDKNNLPKVFPATGTRRGSLGKEWEVTEYSKIFSDIKFNTFELLEYEGAIWNLSYATGLTQGAEVLISQSDSPILVQEDKGEGRVIWSGLNLPFRINYYHDPEEVKMFEKIMSESFGFDKTEKAESEAIRKSGENLKITGQKAKGALLRENYDSGWKASFKSEGDSGGLKIYPAGTDVMYVPLPEGASGEVEVSFKFIGSGMAWFLWSLSSLTVLMVIFFVIFGNKFLKFSKEKIKSTPVSKKLASWWEKDEDEE